MDYLFLTMFIFLSQKRFMRQSAGVRRGTHQPLQCVHKSPSQLAWRLSVNQRSSQTSGAQLCRPRLLLPSMKRDRQTDIMKVTNLKMYLLISAFVSFVRTTRFASFPDHLVIQIKKFTFGLDWVPKKLGEQRQN